MTNNIKLPHPYDEDVEAIVLGTLLSEPVSTFKVKSLLKPEMFFFSGASGYI